MAAPKPSVMLNIPAHATWDDIRSPDKDVETFLKMISNEDLGLRLTEGDLDAEQGASAEALEIFLETPGLYTISTFKCFMKSLRNGHETEGYNRVRNEYEGLRDDCFEGFTVGLYFLDQELLVRENGLRAKFHRPGTTKGKIDIVISTIFWLDHLDRSTGKYGWKTTFLSFDQGDHGRYFDLLFDTRVLFLLRDGGQAAEMEKSVDKMWEWFDTHPQRPVRLAFAMARHGMIWDLSAKGSISRFHRIIDVLRAHTIIL